MQTMEIKTITVKEIKNLGNFQSRTIEATGHLVEGDNPSEKAKELIEFVRSELYPEDSKDSKPKKPENIEIDRNDPDFLPATKSLDENQLVKTDKDEDGIPF